eukprot:CAMPEP_0113303592 /NCGR_PEP_ID=MMETSP0010_2-20120614/3945_1 /TAXON_ID=216773 ORGANISM="Corethron hystrix, Strain 308" /NCGR_SAMPLE_ID=MMETSP0010_2 /ASSEMBLY_ACC=CAM_ASM_000155 /LENGTH=391 /DNA_ID=CAMNT_0000157617 /DNA_START=102 /DNA_END=1274 /DNA_ORIENTATION=- /assembly_acc=CAM_ASM_000155
MTDGGNLDIYMKNLIAATDRLNRKCMGILEEKHDDNVDDLEGSDVDNVDIRSSPKISKKMGGQVTFNFIMGADGAGHELHAVLFDGSPLQKTLNSYDLNSEIKDISLALYNPNEMSKGIWSAPHANYFDRVNDGPKGNLLFNSLTDRLRAVADKVGGKSFDNIRELVIPINALYHFDLSYPSNSLSNISDFPMMQYPSVEILYGACKEAGVTCQHVYLSRDPYEILDSISKKQFFTEDDFSNATHIQLKKTLTMLSVIEVQLESYPHHLAACWNLENGIRDKGALLIGHWYGLNSGDIKEKFSSIKMDLSTINDKKNSTRNLNVYMRSLISATNRINRKCNYILKGNRGSFGDSNRAKDDPKNTRTYSNELVSAFLLLALILTIKLISMIT